LCIYFSGFVLCWQALDAVFADATSSAVLAAEIEAVIVLYPLVVHGMGPRSMCAFSLMTRADRMAVNHFARQMRTVKAEVVRCITQSWCHESSERMALADVVPALDRALAVISDAGVSCACSADAVMHTTAITRLSRQRGRN
jgi:hypothetical protein